MELPNLLFSDVTLIPCSIRVEIFIFRGFIANFFFASLFRFGLHTGQVSIRLLFGVAVTEVVSVGWFVLQQLTMKQKVREFSMQTRKLVSSKNSWSITNLPRFFTRSCLAVMKSNNLGYSSFSMLLNVWTTPDFVSISKSNDLVLPPLRAKLTLLISSNRMCNGGL